MTTIRIRLTHPDGRTVELNHEGPELVLGQEASPLLKEDPSVAARHAAIRLREGDVTLVDLESSEGTFTSDGKRIFSPHPMKVGETVRLGDSHLTLLLRRVARKTPSPASTPIGKSSEAPPTNARPRATILKIPDQTPGLLFLNGEQHEFELRGVWQSPVAPAVNQTVEVDFSEDGVVKTIAVIDSKEIAREKLGQWGSLAQSHAKQAAEAARRGADALKAGKPATKKKAIYAAGTLTALAAVFFAGSGLGLFGGLSKWSLKSKLNDKFEEDGGECLSFQAMENVQFPSQFNPSVANDPIFKGLVAGGHITAERIGQPQRAMFGWGDTRKLQVDLTKKGRDDDVWDAESGFCIGTREVVDVVQWTDPEMGRGNISIEYTWKMDRANWVEPQYFAEVPGISGTLTGHALAHKTDDGWKIR